MSKRVRILKYDNLNLNNFSLLSKVKKTPKPKDVIKTDKDMEVAEILIDMHSDSRSSESFKAETDEEELRALTESPVIKRRRTEKIIKEGDTTPKKKQRTKKEKIPEPEIEESSSSDESAVAPEVEIPQAIELPKVTYLTVFKNAVSRFYLLTLCRRIPELEKMDDEQLVEMLQKASDKFHLENNTGAFSEIYIASQIIRYLIEENIMLYLNLKNRALLLFMKDTKKAMQCVKMVESKLTKFKQNNENDEWESCLDHASKMLQLDDNDKLILFSIAHEVIHEKYLQGKHFKVYVAACICSFTSQFPNVLSKKYEFNTIWEALNSEFNVSRVNLYSATQTLNSHIKNLRCLADLNISVGGLEDGLITKV